MKNQFVKITLTLSMVLALLIPTQAFAAEKTCNLNQTTILNTTLSKSNCTSVQDAINKLKSAYTTSGSTTCTQSQNCTLSKNCTTSQCTSLQNLLKQCSQNSCANGQTQCNTKTTATTPTKTTATTPTKTTTTTPSKTTTSTTPSKTTTTTQTPTSNQTTSNSTSSTIGAYEQQVVDLVNKERTAAGLSALTINTKLANVAEKKAEDMRDNNYFSHTSPTYGSPFDMMKQFGISYTAAGENIAKGQKTPSDVMNGWMNSEGHRANILNANYTEIGVGYVTDSNGTGYWVQEFIRP